jgi:hypothetical protein
MKFGWLRWFALTFTVVPAEVTASVVSHRDDPPENSRLLVPATPLETLGRGAEVAAKRARAFAADAASAATEVGISQSATAADASAQEAQKSASETETARDDLGRALDSVRRNMRGATTAAKAAAMAFRRASAFAGQAEVSAAADARRDFNKDVGAVVGRSLPDWKFAVLFHPLKEARAAGARMALPFEQAATSSEAQAARLDQQAAIMTDRAKALRAQAAVMKRHPGGAASPKNISDFMLEAEATMDAGEMILSAQELEQQAGGLQAQSAVLRSGIPGFEEAAQNVAQHTMHRLAGTVYGPPPMGWQAKVPPLPVEKATSPQPQWNEAQATKSTTGLPP